MLWGKKKMNVIYMSRLQIAIGNITYNLQLARMEAQKRRSHDNRSYLNKYILY